MRLSHLVAAALLLSGPATAQESALPAGFVHLADIAPAIAQDIRYSGAENFLGRPAQGYDGASCILTEKAARAVARVEEKLAKQGLGLVVFDCYRPKTAVADFVAWAGQDGPPDPRWHPATRRGDLIRHGYIASRSAHSRGSTVDLAIVARNGRATPPPACGAAAPGMLDFGTGFDCFDPASRTASASVSAQARRHRRLLAEAMAQAGFRNYAGEWWHFTLRGEPHPKRAFDFPVTARRSARTR